MIKAETNILFVHIPKTAGTSVRLALLSNNFNIEWNRNLTLLYHDPYMDLQTKNALKLLKQKCYTFAVCRNPYTRAYSYYKHFCKINEVSNFTFFDFLKFVHDKKYFPKTPMISYDQSYYVVDNQGKISLDKIYRFENLNELEEDFGFKLDRILKSNYSKEEFLSAYSEQNKNLVKYIYMRDFINFNYSINFTENLYEADNF